MQAGALSKLILAEAANDNPSFAIVDVRDDGEADQAPYPYLGSETIMWPPVLTWTS